MEGPWEARFEGGPNVIVRWFIPSQNVMAVQLFLDRISETAQVLDQRLDASRTDLPFSLVDDASTTFCAGRFELAFIEPPSSPPSINMRLTLADFFYPGSGPTTYVLYPPQPTPSQPGPISIESSQSGLTSIVMLD